MKELFNKLSNVCRFLNEKRFVYKEKVPQIPDDENPLGQKERKDSGAIRRVPITRAGYLKAHERTIAAGKAMKGEGLKKMEQFAPEERQSDVLADAILKPGGTLDGILADVGKLESGPDISGRKYASNVGPDAAIDELIEAAMPGVHPKGEVALSKKQEEELDKMIDKGLKEREEEPLVLSDAQQKEALVYLIKSMFKKTKATKENLTAATKALKKRPDYTGLLATALVFKDRGSQEEKNNFIKYTAQEVVAYEPQLASILGIEQVGGTAQTAVAEIRKESPVQPKTKPQQVRLAKKVNAPQKPEKKQPLPKISYDPLAGIDGPSIIRTPSKKNLARQKVTSKGVADASFERWKEGNDVNVDAERARFQKLSRLEQEKYIARNFFDKKSARYLIALAELRSRWRNMDIKQKEKWMARVIPRESVATKELLAAANTTEEIEKAFKGIGGLTVSSSAGPSLAMKGVKEEAPKKPEKEGEEGIATRPKAGDAKLEKK